jgi:hypothetical protein
MSIDRKLRLMMATTVVFVLLTIIFCWGSTGVNQVHAKQKAAIEQLKGG